MVKRFDKNGNENPDGDFVSFQDYNNAMEALKAWFSLDSVRLPQDEFGKADLYREALMGFRDYLKSQRESCFGYRSEGHPTQPGFTINIPIVKDIIAEIDGVLK